MVVGPTAAADQNNGVNILGNTITNYGTTGTFSSYANVSGTIYGILVRNTNNYAINTNTVTSSVGGVTAGTLRGIFVPTFNNAPVGTITNSVNSNTVSLQPGATTIAMTGIEVQGTSANITTTLTINSNNFTAFGHTVQVFSLKLTYQTQTDVLIDYYNRLFAKHLCKSSNFEPH